MHKMSTLNDKKKSISSSFTAANKRISYSNEGRKKMKTKIIRVAKLLISSRQKFVRYTKFALGEVTCFVVKVEDGIGGLQNRKRRGVKPTVDVYPPEHRDKNICPLSHSIFHGPF